MQKQIIQSIFGLNHNAHTDPYFKKNRILKLEDIIKVGMCKALHKVINYITPDAITKLYTVVNTPTSKTIRVKAHKSRLYNCSYLNKGVMEWQKLPRNLKKITNTHYFTSKLKEHLN